MDLGRLEAFVQVARTGSISKAAESLFVTQPAVTARLQTLGATWVGAHPQPPRQPPDRGGPRLPAACRACAVGGRSRAASRGRGAQRGSGAAADRGGAGGEHLRPAGHAASVPGQAPGRPAGGALRPLGGDPADGAARGGRDRPDAADRPPRSAPPSCTRTSWCWWCIAAIALRPAGTSGWASWPPST